MLVLVFIKDHRVLAKYAYTLLLAGVVFLAIPAVLPAKYSEVNGAQIWIKIPHLLSIQPGEFAKIALIVFAAAFLQQKRTVLNTAGKKLLGMVLPRARDLGPLLLALLLCLAVFVRAHDLGQAMLIAGWRTAKSRWMCGSCGRQTSVTAGTIFHRIRNPLSTRFAAIWFKFITSQKNGVSAQGLQRVLGFSSYDTAWAWLHKLRRAMVRPEREPTLRCRRTRRSVHRQRISRPRGRCEGQLAAMIAVESLPGRKLGRVRMEVAPTARSADLLAFADRIIATGSLIKTDGAINLRKLSEMGYEHQFFVGLDSTEPAHLNLPGVHMIASLLKRWLTGTLHYAASQEHLAYYLDEYTFRFNRRKSKSRGLLFYRLLQQAVNTDPHPLADLRNPVAAAVVPF